MRWLASLVTGRITKWVVVGVWVAILALAAPNAGKLFEVTEDTSDTILPATAESTLARDRLDDFPRGELSQAAVVYHRAAGITAADQARVEADLRALTGRFGVDGPARQIIPSQDGQALIFQVPISVSGARDIGIVMADAIEEIRSTVGTGGDGLDIRVTGPAAVITDSLAVLEDIEFTLLLVPVVVVALLLLLIYRSPVLFIVPLVSVLVGYQVASAAVYGLVQGPGLTLNSLGAGILGILVYGAGTDYALLLIARYREELRRESDRHVAMRIAVRHSLPALVSSSCTVALGLLCLYAADTRATQALGPVAAVGVIAALLATTTLLPALLVVAGRWILWPAIPKPGGEPRAPRGIWARVSTLTAARPRRIWMAACLVVALGWIGLASFGTPEQTMFREAPDSVLGQRLVASHFSAGAGTPADIVVRQADADAALAVARSVPGVASVSEVARSDVDVAFQATLDAEPNSDAEYAIIRELRAELPEDALVGGRSAVNMDTNEANLQDALVLIPLVLVAILIIIGVQLRAIVGPLLMVATVVLSFGAALGAAVLVFENAFHWEGQQASLPVLSFVFLVALGVDYNIFLVSRIRQEAQRIGTRAGAIRGLVVTGGVITSAGVVLAATFSVLASLPVVGIAELGFVVALGVLIDTLIVRSIIVPALIHDVGSRFWWPSRIRPATGPARQPVAGRPSPESTVESTVK